jgi:hypothetical protein
MEFAAVGSANASAFFCLLDDDAVGLLSAFRLLKSAKARLSRKLTTEVPVVGVGVFSTSHPGLAPSVARVPGDGVDGVSESCWAVLDAAAWVEALSVSVEWLGGGVDMPEPVGGLELRAAGVFDTSIEGAGVSPGVTKIRVIVRSLCEVFVYLGLSMAV